MTPSICEIDSSNSFIEVRESDAGGNTKKDEVDKDFRELSISETEDVLKSIASWEFGELHTYLDDEECEVRLSPQALRSLRMLLGQSARLFHNAREDIKLAPTAWIRVGSKSFLFYHASLHLSLPSGGVVVWHGGPTEALLKVIRSSTPQNLAFRVEEYLTAPVTHSPN